MEKILLTSKQLSEITGLNTQTLSNQRSTGRGLPYVKVGACVRYDVEDVKAYIQKNKIYSEDFPKPEKAA